MKDQILVPLDGSTLAEVVLPHAVEVAQAQGLSLVLLRAVPSLAATVTASWGMPPSIIEPEQWDLEVGKAHNYLDAQAARLRETGLEVQTTVIEDEPATTIVRYAEQHPCVKLVAMSTHGRSGLGRWFYGSVAERVLHSCPVPLLLVHARDCDKVPLDEAGHICVPRYDTILVPLDGSPFAEQALDRAANLARVAGAEIVLVTVLPEEPVFNLISETHPIEVQPHSDPTGAALYLDVQADRLKSEGLKVRTMLKYGAPAEAILQASDKTATGMVVMATHGRGGLEKLWLGSVALKVVQGSSKPVMLVRARERVKEPALTYKRQRGLIGVGCLA